MLSALVSTLFLTPFLAAAVPTNAALSVARLSKRDQNINYRVFDLNEKLKKSRPYVRFELAATAGDDLTLVMDIVNCKDTGYNGNKVRVWANKKNQPVDINEIRMCQHFVVNPLLFAEQNSYAIGMTNSSQPWVFETSPGDEKAIKLSAPDELWADGQMYRLMCKFEDTKDVDPNAKVGKNGQRYFAKNCRFQVPKLNKCLAAENVGPDLAANPRTVKESYKLVGVDCDQQLKEPSQLWNIENVSCGYNAENHIPGPGVAAGPNC